MEGYHRPVEAKAPSGARARAVRIADALRIGRVDLREESLFDFKRAGGLPVWLQALAVVACYAASIFFTKAEYDRTGTVFGFPGPAFFVLFAPIVEELVFRGFALGQLVRHTSNARAIALSSLLFGFYHLRNAFWLEPAVLASQMAHAGLVLGPLLAYLTLRFRTVWPAVLLHYANNLAFYL